tara:strand:- start:397 stop:720 length:324 start_codon:yes stop_codon:yes gene_type:complete
MKITVKNERGLLTSIHAAIKDGINTIKNLDFDFSFEYPFTLNAENSFLPFHEKNINEMELTFEDCIFQYPIQINEFKNINFINSKFSDSNSLGQANKLDGSKQNELI